ncbi:MAG: hypothetical protein HY681_03490 [Chloroflexi bacterium]|nr:hypothetical protein [Chloroflexota bacterium]
MTISLDASTPTSVVRYDRDHCVDMGVGVPIAVGGQWRTARDDDHQEKQDGQTRDQDHPRHDAASVHYAAT